uniref:Uncharacterized protein n=1 Tax=uncultured bacterium BLR9 TaxID=506525 RepID=C0INA0_9BACT|nr:hypothetical protein AKSOIL_0141 [uncultured bacterium BLR9]
MPQRKPAPGPFGRSYQAGDVYSFRTLRHPRSEGKETGRYAALKILGKQRYGVCFVVLDGTYSSHPTIDEVRHGPWLRHTRFSGSGEPAVCSAPEHFENDLEDIRYLGSVALSLHDSELRDACNCIGTWSSAGVYAEAEWRWRNDRAAYEADVKREENAARARQIAERERYETRLKSLTWEILLDETPFARWIEHPPFPPPEFVNAARDRIHSTILDLRELGQKPKKSQVRAALKTCVEWFNAMDEKFGNPIETDEREDICTVLEELAFVAKQKTLAQEIHDWRTW